MKIIDEKGRLFGKINVFDFLVILVFIFSIPVFYFGNRLFNRSRLAVPSKYIEFEKVVKIEKVKPDILKLIQVGDSEVDDKGETIGIITWLGKSKPYQYSFEGGSGQSILKEDYELREVYAKLKLKAGVRNNNLFYKDKQILVDSPIEFKTKDYRLSAILALDEKKSVSLNIYAVLKDFDSDTVKLVSEGDKEINAVGEVLVEVLKVGKIENNLYEINLGSGNIMLGEDNDKKQVFAKLRINCEITKSGRLYFKNQEIKYDNSFEFKTDKYATRVVLSNVLVNEKWVEAKIKFSGLIPELAKAISEGDTESDPLGRVVGRLKVIVSNKASESSALSIEQNKFITIPQPFYRDIDVVMNVLCIEKEGVLYFKNSPVKMGNIITFTTDKYSIQGLIIGM